ncbi:MAG: hypothetical protein D6689_06330 [Deltaproteobacteria bacterium]|nr:MAG: hypothetical protein D6689_06330 [Deltaproteobacteria bacterium]
MIRINLLPQKKSKKADAGQQTLAIGFAIVAVVGVLVFLLVHRPLQEEIDSQQAANQALKKKLSALREKTKDFEKLEAAFKAAQAQKEAIDRLLNARVTPAWMMHELSTILTKDKNPTMTPEMAKRVREDPNRAWVQGWDPKHVWITKFEENGGTMQLYGAAQSDSDMTQFVLRLTASVYFDDVTIQSGGETSNKGAGVSFYNFLLSGKVVY